MPFGRCPRCRYASYEYLRTHVYCINCNYSPDLERTYETAVSAAVAATNSAAQSPTQTMEKREMFEAAEMHVEGKLTKGLKHEQKRKGKPNKGECLTRPFLKCLKKIVRSEKPKASQGSEAFNEMV